MNPPPPPSCLAHLFVVYRRLRRRKGSNGFGPQAIEWSDFDAFGRLTGTELSPWEIAILEDLDDLFLFARSSNSPSTGKEK